jgi:uncharacterized coiled-coil DUF342 family protein
MTDNEHKYWAFLSYSRQDNRGQRPDAPEAGSRCWGDWLHDALKTFPIPAEFAGQINGRGEIIPERIDPIFRDESELPGDASLGADIRKALEQSICLIVVCSPRSAKSRQVNEVVRHFKQLGRGRQILPVVVAGEPNASAGNKPGRSPEDECFVPALRHPVQPDGTIDTTRRAGRYIIVDARQGVEKREILAKEHRNVEADLEMAKIQLIALLIGVGFNGLWWREQKRHFLDLAEARHQAREAQTQAEETRRQLEEARRQTREAQNQALERQNLPRDVHGQIQEAQNQAREAQNQIQEFQDKIRGTQTQLEEARNRALAAEGKVLEAQNQAREAQTRLEEAQNQAREVQNTQSQIEETRNQARDAHDQFSESQSQVQEFQKQARSAQSQLEEARDQVCAAQGKVLEAQKQAREAQAHVQEIQNQTRDAQRQIKEAQNRGRNARRLTRIFALLAVLALLAAGIAASMVLRQRKTASQALAKAAAEETGKFDLAPGGMEQIRQALENIGGAEQAENRRRSLDKLAAWIPREEIPEALKASSVILNDRQRSHFQKWLLLRLGWVNPVDAMTCASAIKDKIVNGAGLGDSCSYFQLAVLDNWMKSDLPRAFNWICELPDADFRQRALENIIPALITGNPQNTLARLNDLKPAPDERIYTLLFQRWAANDPVQAIQQRQQVPGHDSDDTILCAILTAWMDQQPAAALNWVESQPDSESRNKALETCIGELAKTDVPSALALAESLPEGAWRCAVISSIAGQTDPAAVWTWFKRPDLPPEMMRPRKASWPWSKFLPNPIFGSPVIFPVETEILPDATNGPVPINPGN